MFSFVKSTDGPKTFNSQIPFFANLIPSYYAGHPSGFRPNTNGLLDNNYDIFDKETLKHLKLSVGSVYGEPILRLDTIDLYDTSSRPFDHTSPSANLSQIDLSPQPVGEGQSFSGISPACPVKFNRVYFRSGGKEYFSVFLVGNPVLLSGNEFMLGGGGYKPDELPEQEGVGWTPTQYAERVVIGREVNKYFLVEDRSTKDTQQVIVRQGAVQEPFEQISIVSESSPIEITQDTWIYSSYNSETNSWQHNLKEESSSMPQPGENEDYRPVAFISFNSNTGRIGISQAHVGVLRSPPEDSLPTPPETGEYILWAIDGEPFWQEVEEDFECPEEDGQE